MKENVSNVQTSETEPVKVADLSLYDTIHRPEGQGRVEVQYCDLNVTGTAPPVTVPDGDSERIGAIIEVLVRNCYIPVQSFT